MKLKRFCSIVLLVAITIFLPPVISNSAGKKRQPVTVCKLPSEAGYGLSKKLAREGWISLFDGKSTFGWTGAKVTEGSLVGGTTTNQFGPCQIMGIFSGGGTIMVGNTEIKVRAGAKPQGFTVREGGAVRFGKTVAVRTLLLLPLNLKSIFNGKDFSGWQIIRHPKLPEERQAKWSIKNGAIHAIGGPGACELQQKFGDIVLQIDVKTKKPLVNGGVFFRCIPGAFMQGYEAQVYNACHDGDPAKVARWSTGAIDDRQLARRLVSRDNETFTMTVIATGPHIATWVNGYQMTDWTDTRAPHDNPRRGLRTKAGTIQLQAHDPETDVEFWKVRVGKIE